MGSKKGVQELKDHEFMRGIDWEQLMKKKVRNPPLRPNLITNNFDPEYMSLPPRLSCDELK